MARQRSPINPMDVIEGQAALLQRHAEDFERELVVARAVQRSMLPPECVRYDGVEVSLLYQPLYHIGGDFCDTRVLGDGTLMVLLADIAGHGVPAAMTFAMLKLAFSQVAREAVGPVELLRKIQHEMSGLLPPNIFITALALVIPPGSCEVRMASAGHPNPLLVHAGKAGEVRFPASYPLLVSGMEEQGEIQVSLAPEDRLLLITDGLLEARTVGAGRSSARALLEAVERHAELRGPALLQAIYETLFFGPLVFHDDVTLVGIDMKPA